ncbi:MAG: hypothetical protein COA94_04900 [Rickettsiales bacterium]|nr:MAG: hypothetical protein COA94_04900 [Rickettsiales bacterium]
MARATASIDTIYIMQLSEKEAQYLLCITQNPIPSEPKTEEESEDTRDREAIFLALTTAGVTF